MALHESHYYTKIATLVSGDYQDQELGAHRLEVYYFQH